MLDSTTSFARIKRQDSNVGNVKPFVGPPAPINQKRQSDYKVSKGRIRNDRWENGFQINLTNLFGKQAFDLTSPSVLFGAQWTYKFSTDTYLGVELNGAPQSMAISRDDYSLSFTTYYAGPMIGQEIYRLHDFRFVAFVSAGKGDLFVRQRVNAMPAAFTKADYNYFQPGIFAIVYSNSEMEIGIVASYRNVSLNRKVSVNRTTLDATDQPITQEQILATNSDLSSINFGVTFRISR